MPVDGVGDWCNRNLLPVFANIFDALKENEADELFYYIAVSFDKNSIAMFESVKGVLRSYLLAQSMRLLMEIEADMDFIIDNPNNISRLKKKADKLYSDCRSGKKKWAETICEAGNIFLLNEDARDANRDTKGRVEKLFDKKMYGFYCAYSHFNIYAVCDDAQNVSSFDEPYFMKANRQKAEILKYYPVILGKFIDSLNRVLKDGKKIQYDSAKFEDEYEKLLFAISHAKIRRPNVEA